MNEDPIGNSLTGHACYIMGRSLCTFLLSSKNLHDDELKYGILINLVNLIYMQAEFQTVAWIIFAAFCQI